mgnify:CR=1 FL=1
MKFFASKFATGFVGVICFVVLHFFNCSAAEALSTGTWRFSANNYSGVIEISSSYGAYQGRLKFDNLGSWEELLELRVHGNSISFYRANSSQRYRGNIHGNRITGSFEQSGSGNYPWEASLVNSHGGHHGYQDSHQASVMNGTWRFLANNYSGVIEITSSSGMYKGRLKFDSLGVWEELLEFRVRGNSISFYRANSSQRYRGNIHGNRITGSFEQSGSGNYPWEANRI